MPTTEPFTLETSTAPLHGLASLPDRPGPHPTVIICHGFKGFMEWGFFPAVADLLAERGFTALRFNLPSSGMSPGDELVTDPDAFRTTTIGADLAALVAVLDAAGDRILADRVDRGRLGLFGHSRGGGLAVLAAARDDLHDPVRALVTWAAVSTFDRFGDADKEAWRRGGRIPIVNARTGQELALGLEVLTDLEAHRERYDVEAGAARRNAPWLIVHGESDETVPVAEGRTLAAAAAPPGRLLALAGGDHTLGARHPFAGPTPMLIQALNATQTWFREHLGTGVAT